MASRTHRWPGDNTPLSGVHGGTAAAARRAIAEAAGKRPAVSKPMSKAAARKADAMAERDAQRYAEWEQLMSKLPPIPTPRKGSVTPRTVTPSNRIRQDRTRPRSSLRFKDIVIAQGERCPLCGESIEVVSHRQSFDPLRPSRDHVIPRVKGGGTFGNILIAHRQCNSDKGDRFPTGCELIMLMAVNAKLGIPLSNMPRLSRPLLSP